MLIFGGVEKIPHVFYLLPFKRCSFGWRSLTKTTDSPGGLFAFDPQWIQILLMDIVSCLAKEVGLVDLVGGFNPPPL